MVTSRPMRECGANVLVIGLVILALDRRKTLMP